MLGKGLTRYPQLSWLTYRICIRPSLSFVLHEYRAVAHRIIVTEEGDADLSYRVHGPAVVRHAIGGSVWFCPADLRMQALGITSAGGYRGHVILVPTTQLEGVWDVEDAWHEADTAPCAVIHDALLRACAHRLCLGHTRGHVAEDAGTEIAARQMITRLAMVTGGRPPEWLKDTSVFTPGVMRQIMERVDDRLVVPTTLADMSSGFGLSPSHFARKFRQSTGWSLNRLINRRRIGLSLALLKTGEMPIAQLSLVLGFSSQSHFTRLFTSLMGFSPYQFRRAQRQMSG